MSNRSKELLSERNTANLELSAQLKNLASSGSITNPLSARELLQQYNNFLTTNPELMQQTNLNQTQTSGNGGTLNLTGLLGSGRGQAAQPCGILSIKDQLEQLDGSLTNLFDSLNKPLDKLVHENTFDLTQKINDNFKDILGDTCTALLLQGEDSKEKRHDKAEDHLQTPSFCRSGLEEKKVEKVSKKMVYAQNEYQNEYLQQQSKAVKKKYIHGGEGQQESSRCKKTEARFPQSQSSAAVFGPEVDPISGPQGVKENDGPPGTGNGQGLRFHPVYFNPPTSNSNKESILGLFGQSNSENPHHQIESTMGPIIYV